jgi:hypothetical protein
MTDKNFPFIARGNQRYIFVHTRAVQNIDNGSGTTADTVVVGGFPTDAIIVGAWPMYTEATDTAGVATATWSLGVTAGGVTIVAATALEVSKAVGSVGASQPGLVPLLAGQTLFMRHTGVATTETGEYILNVLLMLKP